METVLVTGSAGYIGSHLVRLLERTFRQDPDKQVVGLDLGSPWPGLVDVVADITDRDQIRAAVDKVKPTICCHLAALASVGEAERLPGSYHATNVQGTINLCEALTSVGCKHLVFASSAAALTRSGVYGWTKALGEMVLISGGFPINSVALRIFNVAGNYHETTTHLIPNLVRAIKTTNPGIGFGLTADPEATVRDFVHVEDVAEAFAAFVRLGSFRFARYDIGTGVGTSVGGVIATVEQLTGQRVRLATTSTRFRQGDPLKLVAEPAALPIPTVWQPKRDLVDIVRSALVAEGWNPANNTWSSSPKKNGGRA